MRMFPAPSAVISNDRISRITSDDGKTSARSGVLPSADGIVLREPAAEDGVEVAALIKASGSLDENSLYCTLLQCTHFSRTCAIAERDGEVVGWVSGHIPPDQPDTLFIWQVCVGEKARKCGLGKRLIKSVLARRMCANVRRIESTITADNKASWALFGSIAKGLWTEMASYAHFKKSHHFDGAHDTEHLVRIGPFSRIAIAYRPAA